MAAKDPAVQNKPATGNETREEIRKCSYINEVVKVSLQSCSLSGNRSLLSSYIERRDADSTTCRNLSSLRYILDCLLANVSNRPGKSKVLSYMSFDEAYDIYLAYQHPARGKFMQSDRHEKKHFTELVLHPKYGLCVNIVKVKQKEYIVLRPDNFNLEAFYEHCFTDEGRHEPVDKEFIKKVFSSMDTEWDKKILRVVLGLSRTRKEIDMLGMNSDTVLKDRQTIDNFFDKCDELKNEAKKVVKNKLIHQKVQAQELMLKKQRLLLAKKKLWSELQINQQTECIEDLQSKTTALNDLINEETSQQKKLSSMVSHTLNRIIEVQRLKLRKLGSGRKQVLDEIDEKFIAECISSKATAHGRRKDAVLYLHHRVKKRDFLQLANYSRLQRGCQPIKSATTVFNRARPKNMRSRQAKKHLGLGLFCCKKPPKAEDTSSLLTHFCRAHKKNIIRHLSTTDNNLTTYRSFDDKAYLCPDTSTGMHSARSQAVYSTTDDATARKFKKYDFPISMLNCTPGTFHFMSKQVENIDNKEQVRTTEQQSMVIVKPKYFIGSSGLVWSSHLMDLRYREPYLHLLPGKEDWQGKLYHSLCFKTLALLRSLLNQLLWEDICLVTDGEDCAFREYEVKKLSFFSQKFLEIAESVNAPSFNDKENECVQLLVLQLHSVSEASKALINKIKLRNSGVVVLSEFESLFAVVESCISFIGTLNLPTQKPRVVDLTDAGPGVGITNNDVRYGIAQEILITNIDYYIRHHLAPGDSSHNEVERIQSYVGKQFF